MTIVQQTSWFLFISVDELYIIDHILKGKEEWDTYLTHIYRYHVAERVWWKDEM